MTDRILVPLEEFHPWTRAVGRVVTEIESPEDVLIVLLYTVPDDEAERLWKQLTDAPDRTTESVDRTSPDCAVSHVDPDAIATAKVDAAGVTEVFAETEHQFEVVGAVHDGDPTAAILETREREDADRIYLFGRKRSPVGKATFGSTAQGVLFGARVPVVVVPPATVSR